MLLQLKNDSVKSVPQDETQEESSLPETVPLAEALPSLNLTSQRIDPVNAVAGDATADNKSEEVNNGSNAKENVLQSSLLSNPQIPLDVCAPRAMQMMTANPGADATKRENDGGLTLSKGISPEWCKVTGRRRKCKQSKSKKQVPRGSPGTASDTLGQQASVHATK